MVLTLKIPSIFQDINFQVVEKIKDFRKGFNNQLIIKNSKEALIEIFRHYNENLDFNNETAVLLLLNNKDEIESIESISQSNPQSISIDDTDFQQLISRPEIYSLYLAHNHPSSICYPSKDDIIATRKCVEKCREKGVKFNDHLILSKKYYYSFKEDGRL